MKTIYFLMLLSAVALTQCNTPKPAENDEDNTSAKPADEAATPMNAPLQETHWKVIEINGQAVTNPAPNQKEAYIQLTKDNKLQGNGGCNNLMGSYELMDGNRIKFSGVASTMMACPDMSMESMLGKAIESCDNYSIQGKNLSLNKAKMAPLVRFEAQ